MELKIIVSFLAGGLFVGLISMVVTMIAIRSEVTKMVVFKMKPQLKSMKNQLTIARKERNIAIEEAKKSIDQRNEALLMLSNKLGNNDSD